MPTPEALAREEIDRRLEAAGWKVQDRNAVNLGAGLGVAVREFPTKAGPADYLLFAGRKMIGVVEAKPDGVTLSGVAEQPAKYSAGPPDALVAWRKPLPFHYESTGVETLFTNEMDPTPRARPVFAFHRPETLLEWVQDPTTLRARLRTLPPLVTTGLWPAQVEAITNLERSFAADKPRALIQMATGSGKTVTAISFIYRLIKFAKAKRVLFLVDRSNLGRQTLKEFQQYITPDDGRKFTELYNVQRLTCNTIEPVNKVVITTIQRLYSMLSGEEQFDPENEEGSLYELDGALDARPKSVSYNSSLPPETFDFIVTDECHRSIYNLWRQVLEYFDAYLIGLTATPSKQTLGFFNQNLVMEYPRERAVADGVNVDGQVYRIRTEITTKGSKVESGFWVDRRDRVTRAVRWDRLDEDLEYAPNDLDRSVVAEDQIRTVVRAFKEKLFTEMFPGRSEVPKTLVFAKDDSHAEDLVRIIREEFGRGNEFCQKITYRVTGIKTEDLISTFRNSFNPRIAVTVDMIATGTDIKPIEVLLFMRQVKSRVLFEQMLGRGTRVINATDLKAVTPDATIKDRFVIVDAVGVVEQEKMETQTLEKKRTISFAKLIESVAFGNQEDDTLSSLAGRLARLERNISEDDRKAIQERSGGRSLKDLANALLDAIDPDKHVEAAMAATGSENPAPEQVATAAAALLKVAVEPFDSPDLRQTLVEIQRKSEQTIDAVSKDAVIAAGFSAADTERARATVESFRKFIEEHKDEITALQLLYSRPYGQRRLTFEALKELAARIELPPFGWTPETLWRAYGQLERDRVRGVGERRVLTDLVALVRHAVEVDPELVPYPAQVRARYQGWLRQQEEAGKTFTAEQRWWLDRIAEQVGVNLEVSLDDFDYGQFHDRGGRIAAMKVFGHQVRALLAELNEVLVA